MTKEKEIQDLLTGKIYAERIEQCSKRGKSFAEAMLEIGRTLSITKKVTQQEICVTDKLVKDKLTPAEIDHFADSARQRPCMKVRGTL